MKNKKILFITLITIFVVLIGTLALKMGIDFTRLKADITLSDKTGAATITCDKNTLELNEETNCSLTGTLNDSISSVSGVLKTNSYLKITEITKSYIDNNNKVWFGNVSVPSGGATETKVILASDPVNVSPFNIVTFKVKAVSAGAGSITIIGDSNQGTPFNFGGSGFKMVQIEEPVYPITVTSSGGDTPTVSNNAYLSSLKVTLPVTDANRINFNKETFTYNITYNDSNMIDNQYVIAVEATPEDSNATVTGVDTYRFTGDSKTITVEVIAEDRTTKKTYTINASKETAPLDSNTYLSSLTIDKGTIDPTFNKNQLSYNVTVPDSTDSVTVTATPESRSSSTTGDGVITLDQDVKTIRIVVLAESGANRTYSITVTKQGEIIPDKNSDNKLKGLSITGISLDPAFNENITSYSAVSPSLVDKIIISAPTNNSKATVTGAGTIPVTEGLNIINIVVTAENSSKKTYTIRFTNGSKDSSSDDCKLILKSDVYKIDNDKQTINGVSKDHSDIVIKNNLKTDCGTIKVSNEKVTISYNGSIKEYKINRVFIAKTGNKIIRYSIIIFGMLIIITGLIIFLIKYKDKK